MWLCAERCSNMIYITISSGDWDRSLETSSVVAQLKDKKLDGVNGGGKWGEAEERMISILIATLQPRTHLTLCSSNITILCIVRVTLFVDRASKNASDDLNSSTSHPPPYWSRSSLALLSMRAWRQALIHELATRRQQYEKSAESKEEEEDGVSWLIWKESLLMLTQWWNTLIILVQTIDARSL